MSGIKRFTVTAHIGKVERGKPLPIEPEPDAGIDGPWVVVGIGEHQGIEIPGVVKVFLEWKDNASNQVNFRIQIARELTFRRIELPDEKKEELRSRKKTRKDRRAGVDATSLDPTKGERDDGQGIEGVAGDVPREPRGKGASR